MPQPSDCTYEAIMKETNYPPVVRMRIIQEAQQRPKCAVARQWGMSRRTLNKWIARFATEGYAGLKNRSRAPKKPHRALSQQDREQIIALRKTYPTLGAGRLKRMLQLPWAEKTLRKVWHQAGLMPKRRRKHTTKKNLRQEKQRLAFAQFIQVDTKDLDDIPEIYADLIAYRLPRVQYTARDVTSGKLWIAYAHQRSVLHSTVFILRILNVLALAGIDLASVHVQTDNGSEFIGNVTAKQKSLFTRWIEAMGAQHLTIPPGRKTYQADVETAHALIETEFYCLERRFPGLRTLLRKANAYQAWFNIVRDNAYKEFQTPWQIASSKVPNLSPLVPLLPVVLLDSHPLTSHLVDLTTLDTHSLDTLLTAHQTDHHVGLLPKASGAFGRTSEAAVAPTNVR